MLKHTTVLLAECIDILNIKPNGVYVDATLGGGGHAEAILKLLKNGWLYCFDQDDFAIQRAKDRLKDYHNITFIKANFAQMQAELAKLDVLKVDGILFDLGLSSFQIDDETRGFSYMQDTLLDMRMDKAKALTAHEIVNTYEIKDLTYIFKEYGEEKNAFLIAKAIYRNRPIDTTLQLVRICDKINKETRGHSAKRVFQALRIAVNGEIDVLQQALSQSLALLAKDGVLAVISFHSLEDKMVKHFIKENSTLQVPKNLPLININPPVLQNLLKKPILPTSAEIQANPRARSAKLRAAKKSF